MATTGAEIARAYVAITTQMPGVQADITKALGGVDVSAGSKALGGKISASLAGAVGGAVAAVTSKAIGMITSSIGAAVKRVDTMKNFPKMMQNMGYSAADAEKSIKKMSDRLTGLPTSLDAMTGMTQQLAPLVGGLDDATDLSLALNNALLAGGKPAEIQANAMEQYTQMLAIGKVDMAAWRSMSAAMPGQLDQLAVSLLGAGNKSMDLYQAMKDGTVSFDAFNGSLLKLNDEGVGSFASFEQQARDSTDGIATGWANLQTSVTRNLAKIIDKLKPVIDGVISGATSISNAVGPIAESFIDWAQHSDLFVPILSGLAAVLAVAVAPAIWGAVAATWAWTAALLANPLTWIALAIGALVGAIVWFFTKTELGQKIWGEFTRFLGEAWENVSAFFVTVWENYLKPVFEGIGAVLSWVWSTILKPTFEALGAILGWLWTNIVSPIIGLIVAHFKVLGAIFSWLWENIVSPIISLIGAIFGWLWDAFISPIVGWIGQKLNEFGIVVSYLWTNYVQPYMEKVGLVFAYVWENYISPIVSWIGEKLGILGQGFGILWSGAKIAWDNIVSKFQSAWAAIKGVIETLARVIKQDPKAAFEAARNAIGKAWSAIEELAKKPVRFVVDVVIGGLIDTINKLPGVDIPKPKLPAGFATGGILPGMSRMGQGDDQLIAARRGEGVMVSEALRTTRDRAAFLAVNAAGRKGVGFAQHLQAFAFGGLVDPLPKGSFTVSQPYHAGHNGIDLAAASGTKVMAAAKGIVGLASSVNMGGNEIYVQHPNGLGTRYSHLSGFATSVGASVGKGQVIGYVGSTGMALDVDTPVLTKNRGWVRHGDLAVGDVVFDENGSPVNITHVAHWEDRPTYRVTFDDGTFIDADENHLWAVYDYKEKRRGNDELVVVDTKSMAETAVYGQTKLYTRYSVPMAGAVEHEAKSYRIDPYALGVWLGNGHAANARITCGRDDVDEMRELLSNVGESSRTSPDCNGHFLLTLIGDRVPDGEYKDRSGSNQHPEAFSVRLKAAGLVRNKHIPDVYMRGSVDQRMALLAGLIDTDGYVDPRQGTVEFVQASDGHRDLAYQILDLALSLGFKATMREDTGRTPAGNPTPRFRVQFTPDVQVFRLPRKAAVMQAALDRRSPRGRARVHRRFVQSVELVESRDTNCITVDGESHLYLAGERLVPTHNSTGPHLHYMVHSPGGGGGFYGNHVNPAGYMGDSAEAWSLLDGLVDWATSSFKKAFPDAGLWVDMAGGLMTQAVKGIVASVTGSQGVDNMGATLYDSGGWLEPGKHLVENRTRHPEAVFTRPQLDELFGDRREGPRAVTLRIGDREFEGWMDERVEQGLDEFTADSARYSRQV